MFQSPPYFIKKYQLSLINDIYYVGEIILIYVVKYTQLFYNFVSFYFYFYLWTTCLLVFTMLFLGFVGTVTDLVLTTGFGLVWFDVVFISIFILLIG